ncbi:hypothetical protein ACOSQ3_029536 [Xanthoceras sorbifolium]
MNSPIHVASNLKLFTIFLVLFVASCSCFVASSTLGEDDVKCLEGVKSSLNDPEGKLSSWSFKNSYVAFLCRFVGVSCWNDTENRIINLELREMKLSGQVPESLQYCQSLQKLDLSANELSGTIPPQLCSWLPYLATLDLSNNDLTGSIPPELGNFAAGVFGATLSLLLSFALGWKYHFRWVRKKKRGAHHHVEVSLFKTPLVTVKLADLMKAVLLDGSVLAIKLLHTCKLGEKQFRSEVNRLGQLKHPNLATLLGNTELDWPIRFRIGLGAARGLAWLHHSPFLHQNICSNVILVDEDFDARIMDFGLDRLMTSSYESVYVNGDLGEFGYIAPEYSSTMVPSPKEDVYGLGVVLLELVTGQKPLEISTAEEGFKGNLVDWVNQLSNSGRIKDAIDKALCGNGYNEEILWFLKIASNCVVSWSMYQVHQSLNSICRETWFLRTV